MPKEENKFVRILVVEDNPSRHIRIRSLCDQSGLIPIIASSAGRAIGILQRDSDVIAGVMLDHDLYESAVTETDFTLSGKDVVRAIIKHLPKWIPILVHSMNPGGANRMARQLETAGFYVEQVPMSELSTESFSLWIEEVLESWDPDM